MNPYIEEMVRTGSVGFLKLRGTAQAVFKMIQVLAEYHPFDRDETGWELWTFLRRN